MKITTFDPLIMSAAADDVIGVFEDLGFKKTHAPVTDTGDMIYQTIRMKHEGGYHVDVADVPDIGEDRTCMRMNVDDFQEAYDLLISRGFKNELSDRTVKTSHSKEATMVSPSGFSVVLIEHIRKEG
ncbi:MAG: hypothetical protein K6G58_05370 [Lachnospiraceae bacterium]|nr:hypothetical protein [Lachnospiraceae bacterium]